MEKTPTSGSTVSRSNPPRWILIVDDEPAMQRLIETILSDQGYAIQTANGAANAMAAVENSPTPPSMLISDVLMPGLDGLELTRRMLAKIPALKVILISGHLTDVSWWPTDLREHRFLTKPFSRDELINTVQDVMSSGVVG